MRLVARVPWSGSKWFRGAAGRQATGYPVIFGLTSILRLAGAYILGSGWPDFALARAARAGISRLFMSTRRIKTSTATSMRAGGCPCALHGVRRRRHCRLYRTRREPRAVAISRVESQVLEMNCCGGIR